MVIFIQSAGMSDLCSPMIILLNDEADSFWCFERLMRRLVSFDLDKRFISTINLFLNMVRVK